MRKIAIVYAVLGLFTTFPVFCLAALTYAESSGCHGECYLFGTFDLGEWLALLTVGVPCMFFTLPLGAIGLLVYTPIAIAKMQSLRPRPTITRRAVHAGYVTIAATTLAPWLVFAVSLGVEMIPVGLLATIVFSSLIRFGFAREDGSTTAPAETAPAETAPAETPGVLNVTLGASVVALVIFGLVVAFGEQKPPVAMLDCSVVEDGATECRADDAGLIQCRPYTRAECESRKARNRVAP